MISLDFLSDAVLAGAFLAIPLAFVAVMSKQERLTQRFKMASALLSAGFASIACAILAPHVWPPLDGTAYETVINFAAASLLLNGSYFGWTLIRLAIQQTRVLTTLPSTELLLLERDDLAAAKGELEREIVRHSYKLERANRQMRLALLGSSITVFRQDKDLRYTWMFNAPAHTQESDFIGRTDAEIFAPDEALSVSEVKKAAMETHEEQSAEIRIRYPEGNFWYFLRTQPDYDETGQIIGTISCAVDFTEHKRREQRQKLLMREVTHRSKNLLAVLQSIVRQTALRTRNIDDFLLRLNARLQSIAKSHDLLVNDDWSGTSLKKLLQSQLAVLSDMDANRVRADGPELLLSSAAVQNLGLGFHELSTNAMKYGSLSAPGGSVDIRWDIVPQEQHRNNGAAEEDNLQLVWVETGGPSVVASEEIGFGRTLLERVVGQALGGTVKLDFASDGLRCAMTLPVSRAIANSD